MFAVIGSAMAKLRYTPRKSTVEVVDVLNESNTDVGRKSSQFRDEQVPRDSTTVNAIRSSPRKRKEPPTEVAGPKKLPRVSKAMIEQAIDKTAVPSQGSSPRLAKNGKRQSIYDRPGTNEESKEKESAPAAKPKGKRRYLTRPVRRGALFTGVPPIDLPEPELGRSSSPAQATKSHEKADRRAPQVQSVEPEEQEPPQVRGRGRVSKGAVIKSSKLPAVEGLQSTSKAQAEPPKNSSDHVRIEIEGRTNGAQSDIHTHHNKKARKRRTVVVMRSREALEATAGVEDAILLYGCSEPWTWVLAHAKKMVRPAKTAKSKHIVQAMDIIKSLKADYNTIYYAEVSEDEIDAAEANIKTLIRQLKDLRNEIANVDHEDHDPAFIEQIHQQIIPRISFMMKAALAARFQRQENGIPIESLEELVGLTNIVLAFRNVAEQAKNRPKELMNEDGEKVLGLGREAIAKLKIIKRNYSEVISEHRAEITRAEEARRREAMIGQDAEFQEQARQTRQEKAAELLRMQQEEMERRATAARRRVEQAAAQNRQWKQTLMTNPSAEAALLRKKFGLPYRHIITHAAAPAPEDPLIDIEDLDSDSELTNGRTAHAQANGVNNDRPRPQREPTEDIPAPSADQSWTVDQNVALTEGLKTFRGTDRYENILRTPKFQRLLHGKSSLDLEQRALFIKETMRTALVTGYWPGGMPVEGDWSWLRSVPD